MIRPTLSALMPNYNHGRFLRQSLGAILAQSYAPAEVLVIDDASTDESLTVLDEVAAGDPRVRVIRNQHNLGVIPNLNRLLEEATGDYVTFCAADDLVLPGFFERSMSLLARHPEAGLCSALAVEMDEGDNVLGVFRSPIVRRTDSFIPASDAARLLVRLGSWFFGNTVVFRREALLEVGGFEPELRAYTDGFSYTAVALRHGACFVPAALAVWRRLPTGYAAQTVADLDLFAGIREKALALMEETHRGLFPPEYVRRWTRSANLSAARAALRSGGVTEVDAVARFVGSRQPHERDLVWRRRVAAAALPPARRIGTAAAEGVLVLRYPSVHLVGNRLHRLTDRRRTAAAEQEARARLAR